MVDNINVGPCLTLAELATQVNEALDGAVGSSPTFAVELLSTPVIPYGDPPTLTIEDNTGGSPPTDYKIVFNFPQQGSGGAQGDPGDTPVFTRPVLVDVLAAGVEPYVTMSEPTGDPPAYQLTFGVAPGADGVAGTAGKTPTFVAGTATDLSYGSSPTVSLPLTPGSDPPKYTLNVGIPRGPAGSSSGDSSLVPAIIVRLTTPTGSRGKLLGAYHSSSLALRPAGIGTTIDLQNNDGFAEQTLKGQVWVAGWSSEAANTDYQLLHELRPLNMIKGTAAADFHSTSDNFVVEAIEVINGRLPTDDDGIPLSEVTVENTIVQAQGVEDEEVYLVHAKDAGDDESTQWIPYPKPGFLLVRGTTASAVADSDDFITLSSVVAVRGISPGAGLQINNVPPCVFSAGDLVYAAYNPKATKKWDTGDAHNFMGIFKGIGGWEDDTDQSPGHDDKIGEVVQDPVWQEDMPCA